MNDILLKSFNFHELIDMLVDFERNNQSCSLKELSAILNLTAFQQYSEAEIKEFIENLIFNMKGNNYNV